MSDIPIISNPLGWAQLQLVGGWRRFWMLAVLYGGTILFFSILIYRGAQPGLSISAFASGAMTLIIFVQAGLFFLVGTNQIRRAVQRDYTTDMITSHRLTAMSGAAAVMGYLTGTLAQVAAMTLMNWLACTVFAYLIGPGPSQSLYAPTMLFVLMGVLAITCWSLAVLVALCTRGKAAITGLLVVLGVASNLTITAALPGLFLLLAIARVTMVTQAQTLPIDQNFVFISMVAQALLTVVFILAAARKYHRDDVQAFTLPLAYVLVAIWSLICATALRFFAPNEDVVIDFFSFAADSSIQWIVTLASLALIACVPITGAAKADARWARRRMKDPAYTQQQPRRPYETAIFTTLVVFIIFIPVMGDAIAAPFIDANGNLHAIHAGYIFVSFLAAALTLAGLFRYGYSLTPNGLMFGTLLIFLLWFMPIIADMMLEVLYERPWSDPKSLLYTSSPIGTWAASLRNQHAPVALGLAVQGALAVFALMLARRARSESPPAV